MPCRHAADGPGARLALLRFEVYAGPRSESSLRMGWRGDIEREGAMTWIKPAFDEIKMDAEAKSYSDGLTW
jgi:hypothetical protein